MLPSARTAVAMAAIRMIRERFGFMGSSFAPADEFEPAWRQPSLEMLSGCVPERPTLHFSGPEAVNRRVDGTSLAPFARTGHSDFVTSGFLFVSASAVPDRQSEVYDFGEYRLDVVERTLELRQRRERI